MMISTSRVRIISAIIKREVNISKLAEMVGLVESAVSHHKRGLRQMRIFRARREGKEVYSSFIDPHVVELYRHRVRHVQIEISPH